MSNEAMDELGQQWRDAKKAEDKAKAARVEIEIKLVELLGCKPEGSTTHKSEAYKVEVTGVINRKMDWEAWAKIKDSFPEALRPIKTKEELDERGVKYLQAHEPELYAKLPITATPGKTGVKVTVL